MNESILTTLAASGFTIAFLHAPSPTHGLPCVLTRRVQKWSHGNMPSFGTGLGMVIVTSLTTVGVDAYASGVLAGLLRAPGVRVMIFEP